MLQEDRLLGLLLRRAAEELRPQWEADLREVEERSAAETTHLLRQTEALQEQAALQEAQVRTPCPSVPALGCARVCNGRNGCRTRLTRSAPLRSAPLCPSAGLSLPPQLESGREQLLRLRQDLSASSSEAEARTPHSPHS